MATKYNPYNAVNEIVKRKASWHTAKEQGEDPTRYQQEAVSYYNELRNNGENDLADALTMADYNEAAEILKGYNAPREYDDWYDNLTGDMMKEASRPVQSDTVRGIMSAYDKNNNMLNGDIAKDASGNVVSGLNLDHYNVGRNQLDYINNYDMTSQPWYNSLMAQYQLQGSDAAKGALASGASSNSGNIDSYAAANANRQQLAFTNAGTQAALDTVAQNLAAWQSLYDSMGGRLDTMGSQANDLLNIGSQYYQVDSAERQNALNQAAALEAQKYQNQINELLANITADTTKYQADRTLEGSKYGADIDLRGAQYKADQALQEAYAQSAADRYKADRTYEADMAKIQSAKAEAEDKTLDEDLTLDEVFGDIVANMKAGNIRFDTWDQLEDFLVENGYNIKKVRENISTYANRYPTPQSVVGK